MKASLDQARHIYSYELVRQQEEAIDCLMNLLRQSSPSQMAAAAVDNDVITPLWAETMPHAGDMTPWEFVLRLIRDMWRRDGEKPGRLSLPRDFIPLLKVRGDRPSKFCGVILRFED